MKNVKLSILSTAIVSLAAIGLLPAQGFAAGAASLAFSPSSANYTVNKSYSVTINENSGTDSVNTIEADFTFDASKLQFLGASCAGSFEIAAQVNAQTVTCATTTAKTGVQPVGTLTFKALAGSGTSSLSFASTSHIYRSTDNVDVWNGVSNAATFGFVTPSPAAPVVSKVTPITHSAKSIATTQAITTTTTTPVASPTPTTTSAVKGASATSRSITVTTAKTVQPTKDSKLGWIISGIIVLAGLTAIGIYLLKNKRTKKITSGKETKKPAYVAAAVVTSKKNVSTKTSAPANKKNNK